MALKDLSNEMNAKFEALERSRRDTVAAFALGALTMGVFFLVILLLAVL